MSASAGPPSVNHGAARRAMRVDPAARRTTASSTSTRPIAEASSTRPGRSMRMKRPIRIAIGIVAATVKVAHGLMLHRVHDDEAEHGDQDDHDREHADHRERRRAAPSSSRAIWPSERPSRRSEQNRITKSCTQPPSTRPPRSRACRAGSRTAPRASADQRARAGDRREVVSEHDPAVRRHEVAAVVEPLGGRRAGGVEREHVRREKAE